MRCEIGEGDLKSVFPNRGSPEHKVPQKVLRGSVRKSEINLWCNGLPSFRLSLKL